MFDFSTLAADQPRFNLSLDKARKIAMIYGVLGFGHPRLFAEAKPGAMPPGVLLIPERAQQGDDSRWPDRVDVDTTGNDLVTMFAGDDPGDNAMFLMVSVDGCDDFFTCAPWYTALTDPKRESQRLQLLTAMKHEVEISTQQAWSEADEAVLPQVNSILGIQTTGNVSAHRSAARQAPEVPADYHGKAPTA